MRTKARVSPARVIFLWWEMISGVDEEFFCV